MTVQPRWQAGKLRNAPTALLPALLCLAVFAVVPAKHVVANETAGPDSDSEALDLIYLAPRAPIFVSVRVRSEGKGFFALREAYVEKLFKDLDASGDGLLKEEELAMIPPAGHLVPVGGRNMTASSRDSSAADANSDGQVTRDEFMTYFYSATGPPFQITTEIQTLSPGQSVMLFDRLDRDRDNRLTDDELIQAARRLRLMDFDLDEQIAAEEIPLPTVFGVAVQNANTPAGQAAASLSLLEPINRKHVDDALVRRVIQLYDKLSRGPAARRFVKDGRLSAKEMGLEEAALTPFDHNHDSLLDPQELRDFLAHPQPIIEIEIEFGDDSTTSAIRSTTYAKALPAAPLQFMTREDGNVLLRLNDVEFQLVASPWRQPVRAMQFTSFVNADNDKNEYLDNNEFGNAIRRFDTNQFALVDTDGDGMIVREEFSSFVSHQVELQKHVLSLSLASEGESLFRVVDTTVDGRLDADELAALKSRILSLDRNGDGNLDREELAGNLRMILARGDSSIQQQQADAASPQVIRRSFPQRAIGNGWFAKMDRNRDQRLTKKEFLGPLDVFEKLDVNGDGWLGATEANP